MERNLIKVTFAYDNGDIEHLDGKNLEKWEDACNTSAVMSWNHFGESGFENIKFKKEKEEKMKQKKYVRKGGIGQNDIPKDGIPKVKVGDKIRVIPEKKGMK